jgi:hypothetical protein
VRFVADGACFDGDRRALGRHGDGVEQEVRHHLEEAGRALDELGAARKIAVHRQRDVAAERLTFDAGDHVANERLEIRFLRQCVAVVADGSPRETASELGVRHGNVDGAPCDVVDAQFLLGALQPP